MSRRETRRVIEVQAEVLGPVLYAGMAASLTAAHARRRGLDHSQYPHLLPLLVRAELREFLDASPMPLGWTVGGDSRKMGQLLLCHDELNLEMRVLKERRTTYPNGIPVAGRNPSRREAWAADPLDLRWASSSTGSRPGQMVRGRQVGQVRLLLVWDFVEGSRLQEFTLRVVHTIGAGVYGRAVPCDLILDVKDGGEIFKSLEFVGSEEDADFFGPGTIEIDEGGDEVGS